MFDFMRRYLIGLALMLPFVAILVWNYLSAPAEAIKALQPLAVVCGVFVSIGLAFLGYLVMIGEVKV